MQSWLNILQNFFLRLGRADVPFFLLPALMVILITGTLSQRWIGLYESERAFFSSIVFWAGPLPLPGGALLIGTLTFCLTLKFLLKSRWNFAKAGINLTHLGVLILLAGGLLTSILAEESYMPIAEGSHSAFIYDYYQQDLMIMENQSVLASIPFEKLKNEKLSGLLPFEVSITQTCSNCEILKRDIENTKGQTETYQGMARFMKLRSSPPEKVKEENLSGLTLKVTGLDKDQDGIYVAFDPMPKPITLDFKGSRYVITFGKRQKTLPFSLELVDFKKENYPGTSMAKAYSSDLIVQDGPARWPVKIEMNKPLRYKGYTFFQSSFERGENGETTVLSVVKNKGRLFPYIGTLVIALGLLLHILTINKKRRA